MRSFTLAGFYLRGDGELLCDHQRCGLSIDANPAGTSLTTGRVACLRGSCRMGANGCKCQGRESMGPLWVVETEERLKSRACLRGLDTNKEWKLSRKAA